MSIDDNGFDPRDFLEAFFAELARVKKLGRPAIAEALREWEVEDLHWETPWSDIRPGWNSIEEHAEILGAVGDKLSHYTLTFKRFYATDDPDTYVVEAEGGGPRKDGTGEYRNEYVMFITLRDRKVAAVREYYNPLNLAMVRN